MAQRLILVRHGNPDGSSGAPASGWRLSAHGLARSGQLARRLEPVSASKIYTSTERKAVETAQAIGDVLHLPVEVVKGLHEHERPDTPLLEPGEFEAAMKRFFSSPAECVFGRESADATAARFRHAIAALTSAAGAADLIVVTHGTVMTLFLAESNGVDPFTFWRGLPMPCAALVRLPSLTVEAMVSSD